MSIGSLLVIAALLGCGQGADPPGSQLLWPEHRTWVRSGVGWAQAVEIGTGRSCPVPSRGLRFRALAIPVEVPDPTTDALYPSSNDGPPSLEVRLDGRPGTAIPIVEPTPIDHELGSAQIVELVTSGEVALVRPRLVDPATRGRRMVLVVADTLRADHATREHMPGLFESFADGLRIENAFSPAAWTLPAIASLFSGERPPRLRAPDGSLIALAEGRGTLARQLADRGWMPVAVVANETVNHENGFSQGFEVFEVPSPRADADRARYDARWMVERASGLVEVFDDQDLFLYLQPMDAHDPYHDRATGDRLPAPKSGTTLDPEALSALRSAYASEVRYLDQHLAPWLSRLDRVETAVFTADHGEELFDHGGFRHGPTLVDEVVRVPLWVRGEGLPAGQDDRPVSLTALHRFLLARSSDPGAGIDFLVSEDEPVSSETFTFGPPRFSTVVGDARPIAFARPLEPGEPIHPIEAWLRATHPALSDAGRSPDGPPRDTALGERLLRGLAEHYRGYRPGCYVALDPGAKIALEIAGAAPDGWYWGHGEAIASRQGVDRLELDLSASHPFVLAFVPAGGDGVEAMELLLDGQPIDADQGFDGPGVRLWLDPGRPAEELAGQTETLERLRALGYL